MKNLTLLSFLVFTMGLSAQEFAPVGAIWHYDQATINPNMQSYHTIESISDTLIEGRMCQSLLVTSRHAGQQFSWLYTCASGDSVLMYVDSAFYLLYDFSAVAGDTLVIGHYRTDAGSPLLMVIDSTSTMVINGHTRRVQYVTSGDGLSIEFGGTVIEGVGNTMYLLPVFDMATEGPLRCYSDRIIGAYTHTDRPSLGWNFMDCEQVIVLGVDQPGNTTAISVYPNPTSAQLFIEGIETTSGFLLYDLLGKPVMRGTISSSSPINISNLPNGIYSLVIHHENTQPLTQRVVKF